MKVELMSPAGSYEALMSAIQACCDSVYFGIEQLNMRARSSNNFTLEGLQKNCSNRKRAPSQNVLNAQYHFVSARHESHENSN